MPIGSRTWRAAWFALAITTGIAPTIPATQARDALTVTRRHRLQPLPVPSPLLPGAPIPWTGSPLLSPATIPIVDQRTRFLTECIAEQRCPGERIVFVPGIVNPFRPTLPGDGAFMCHRDAVAQGMVGP